MVFLTGQRIVAAPVPDHRQAIFNLLKYDDGAELLLAVDHGEETLDRASDLGLSGGGERLDDVRVQKASLLRWTDQVPDSGALSCSKWWNWWRV